jgi:N6-adenosine-specific RNA methylase IME4
MSENSLVIFTKASQMLAEAVTVQKAKELKDLALTAADWAKRKGMGEEAITYAQSYSLQAERRMGEMLKASELNKGASAGGKKVSPRGHYLLPRDKTPTLKELGLTKNESARAQKVAELDKDIFDEVISKDQPSININKALKKNKKKQTYNTKVAKELPKEVYSVILADPPWSYSNSGFNQSAASKYPTMPTEEICKLNIEKLADKDSVLFLWVTVPLLPDGLRVMESWGYSYKTSMVWIKDRSPGIGFWLNTKHEILLIGSKGSFLPLNKVDSIIKGEVTKHSKKPEVTYSLIEKMFPKAKYIELFARNKRSNWSNWGNETL